MEKKHLTKFFMLAVAVGTLFGACQKEDIAAVEDDFDMTGRIPLYAEKLSSASGAKLVAEETDNAHKFNWRDGDAIMLKGGAEITVMNNSIAETDLTTIDADNPLIAVYPADACDESTFGTNQVTITIPHEIEYAGDGVVKMPMMAYTTDISGGITFKHLASVLAVKVTNTNYATIKMDKITVSFADKPTETGAQELAIAGKWEVPYTVSEEGGITINPNNTAININQDGTNDYKGSITMTFDATPCSIESNGTKYFFFPIRPIENQAGHFTIEVEASDTAETDGKIAVHAFKKTQPNKAKEIKHREIAYAPVELNGSTSSLAFFLGDGYYNIASGNLAYNTTTSTWYLLHYNTATVETEDKMIAFEDYSGDWYTDPAYVYDGTTDNHLMSLFFYGSAAENRTALPCITDEGNLDIRDYPSTDLSGTTDWGSYYNQEEGWETPSSSQWSRLFSDQNNYYYYKPDDNVGYKLSDLTIEGFIVVPSIKTFAKALKKVSGMNLNNENPVSLSTLFTSVGTLYNNHATFADIAKCGAVFIPYAKRIYFDGSNLQLESSNLYATKDQKFFDIENNLTDRVRSITDEDPCNTPVRLIRKASAK